MKLSVYLGGAMIGLSTWSVALGSIPSRGRVTDDTAIYQNLSEIRVPRQAKPNFDDDIERLNDLESRYKERLPSLADHQRLKAPMKRVSAKKYRFSGNKVATRR